MVQLPEWGGSSSRRKRIMAKEDGAPLGWIMVVVVVVVLAVAVAVVLRALRVTLKRSSA